MWPFYPPTPTLETEESSVTADHPQDGDAFTISNSPIPASATQHPYADVTLSSVPFTGYSNERLSIPPLLRIPILLGTAFGTGLALGSAKGGQRAADRYRAENAHRFPTTHAGWYLYQRTKSYHTVVGGVKAGTRFGLVLSLWAAGFCATEEGVDLLRGNFLRREGEEPRVGQRDFVSTVVAALAVAGAYSRVERMDWFATVKTTRMALKSGLAFGLAQDFISCVRGEMPGYLRWVVKKVKGKDTAETTEIKV